MGWVIILALVASGAGFFYWNHQKEAERQKEAAEQYKETIEAANRFLDSQRRPN